MIPHFSVQPELTGGKKSLFFKSEWTGYDFLRTQFSLPKTPCFLLLLFSLTHAWFTHVRELVAALLNNVSDTVLLISSRVLLRCCLTSCSLPFGCGFARQRVCHFVCALRVCCVCPVIVYPVALLSVHFCPLVFASWLLSSTT